MVFYEGRPSQTQVERADALARELADVVKAFDDWAARDLAKLNTTLTGKQLEPVKPLTRAEWEAASTKK